MAGSLTAANSLAMLLGIPLVLTSLGDAASLPLFLRLAFHSTVLFTAITVLIEVGRLADADRPNPWTPPARPTASLGDVVAQDRGPGYHPGRPRGPYHVCGRGLG